MHERLCIFTYMHEAWQGGKVTSNMTMHKQLGISIRMMSRVEYILTNHERQNSLFSMEVIPHFTAS